MSQNSPIKETQRLRYQFNKQVAIDNAWALNWGWYITANKQLQDEIRIAYGKKADVDPRNPKPFPDTTNKVYGWLVAKPDFRLEKYGPDVEPVLKLPDIYKIK